MALRSMTGYARAEGAFDPGGPSRRWSWSWELRSVNARGLDIRCRVPDGAERLEVAARKAIAARIARGAVSARLALADAGGARAPRIDRAFLRETLALRDELAAEGIGFPPLRLDALLAVRGAVEPGAPAPPDAEESRALDAAALAGLERALDGLTATREEEGARLRGALDGYLDALDALLRRAVAAAEGQAETLRARLRAQIAELLDAAPPPSEERLAQELALLAAKADTREETERLAAHLAACRGLLAGGGAVGRRLDFLCQELNREANTVCSKSAGLPLTALGLEIKAEIERFREQVQNVE